MLRGNYALYRPDSSINCNLLYLIESQIPDAKNPNIYNRFCDFIIDINNNTFGFYYWILNIRNILMLDNDYKFIYFIKSCNPNTIYFIYSWLYADTFPTLPYQTDNFIQNTYNIIFLPITSRMTKKDELKVALELFLFFTLFSKNEKMINHCLYMFHKLLNDKQVSLQENIDILNYFWINKKKDLTEKTGENNDMIIIDNDAFKHFFYPIFYILFFKSKINIESFIQSLKNDELVNLFLNHLRNANVESIINNIISDNNNNTIPETLQSNLIEFYKNESKMLLFSSFSFSFSENREGKKLHTRIEIVYKAFPFLRKEIEKDIKSFTFKTLPLTFDVMNLILYYAYTGINNVYYSKNEVHTEFIGDMMIVTPKIILEYLNFYVGSKKLNYENTELYWNMGYINPLTESIYKLIKNDNIQNDVGDQLTLSQSTITSSRIVPLSLIR